MADRKPCQLRKKESNGNTLNDGDSVQTAQSTLEVQIRI